MQTMEVFQPTGHRLMKNLQIHVIKPFKTTSITQGVMVALMTCQYTKAPEEEQELEHWVKEGEEVDTSGFNQIC